MRITIHYLAQLRRAAGCASETLEVAGAGTLGQLLDELARRHGTALQGQLLGPDGRPNRTLLFFVGDESAGPERGLHDGDIVTILAPMAGG